MEDVTLANKEWIFSERLDFWAHLMPVIAGAVLAPWMWCTVGPDELPLWGYLIVVVFCDVGHVWGTIFRTYLDTAENNRRWVLYNVSPLLIFLVTFTVHYAWSEALFWTFTGYFAVFHFVRQQWGFICLYRARAGEVEGRLIDRWVHTVGALGPIVVWHADAHRNFDWFMRDDPFLLRLPPWCREMAAAVYVATVVAYVLHNALGAPAVKPSRYKLITMACCYLTWAIGILLPHKLIAVFFLNMFHAAPSYMIVYFSARNKFRVCEQPTHAEQLVARLTRPGAWPLYLAFFVAIAVAEEVCPPHPPACDPSSQRHPGPVGSLRLAGLLSRSLPVRDDKAGHVVLHCIVGVASGMFRWW